MRISILFSFLILVSGFSITAHAEESAWVDVSGEGVSRVNPEWMAVQFSVWEVQQDKALAKSKVDQRTQAALKVLQQNNVAKADIDAGDFRLAPEYSWDNNTQKLTGYRATRSVRAVVRDLKILNTITDGLLQAGVSEINQVEPGRESVEKAEQEALAKAYASAKSKANELAKASDRRLGAVLEISEQGISRPPMLERGMKMQAMAADEPAFDPGMLEVRAQVRIKFALK
ncbi:MAG: SIMPL domain-containing protein [Gammaproteobacteria bacterium]|nr:SIMPL domain-containing protein [Gammaproteobacteria bacterium]